MLEDKNLEEMTVEELEKLKRYIDKLDYKHSENERTSIGFYNFFDSQQKALKKIDREIINKKKREEKAVELDKIINRWGELTNKLTELGYEWDIKYFTGYLVVCKDGEKVIDFVGNCAEQNKVIEAFLINSGVEV